MEKDPKKDEHAVAMYRDGVPVDEICKFLHIGPDRLYEAIDAAGEERRTRQNCPKPTKEQIQEAIRLYLEGKDVAFIVVTTSVSRSTLNTALKRREIPIRGKSNWNKKNRGKKKRQTTTNLVMLQNSFGDNFEELCNRVLRGELDFQI